MEPYDLEIGPIERTFDSLFKSITQYFQTAQVVPLGLITETHLADISQEELHKALNAILKHYGFSDLPFSMRVSADAESQISGIIRSDNIATYEENMVDGSRRTFNFYSTYGPENMKASYYWMDMKRGGEQTQGILTKEDRWYLRITTQENVFFQRTEKESPHYW